MSRGPRGLRGEVQKTRLDEPVTLAPGSLSDCLREAGADVVTRGSSGKLLKTDVSVGSIGLERSTGGASEAALRAELNEKTKALQALQRNYQSVSALSATQSLEVVTLRRQVDEHDRVCDNLRKEIDRLKGDLRRSDDELLAERQSREQLEQQLRQRSSVVADKSVAELQAALKVVKAEVHRLQDSEKMERGKSAAMERKLQEALRNGHGTQEELDRLREAGKDSERLLQEARQQLDQLRDQQAAQAHELETARRSLEELQKQHAACHGLVSKLRVAEQLRAGSASEATAAQAKLRALHERVAQQEAERAQQDREAGVRLAEAAARAQAAEANLRELEERTVREAEALRAALEAERAQVAAMQGELKGGLQGASKLQVELGEAKGRLLKAEKELAEMGALRAKADALADLLATSRDETAAAREEAKKWGQRAAELEASSGSACARLRKAEANLELLQSQLDESRTEVSGLRAELDAKARRMAALQERLDKAGAEQGDREREAEDQLIAAGARARSAEARVRELEKQALEEAEALKAALERERAQVAELRLELEEVEDAKALIAEARAQREAAIAAHREQEQLVKSQAEALERVEEEADGLRTEATELRSRLALASRSLADLGDVRAEADLELAAARKEAAAAKEDAKRWGDRVTELESGHSSMVARLRKAEAELELLQSQLDESHTEASSLRAELEVSAQRAANRRG